MAETGGMTTERQLTVRHRGRIAQIGIFFWKFLRTFIYQSDWKVLPMAALIAGLVGFALGGDFRVTREGTLLRQREPNWSNSLSLPKNMVLL